MNEENVIALLSKRAIFCQNKKYNDADNIRNLLLEKNILIYDKKTSSGGRLTGWKLGKHGQLNLYHWSSK